MIRSTLTHFYLVLIFSISIIARSQSVKIGTLDLYGNRSVSSELILQATPVKVGDFIDQHLFLNRRIENSIERIQGIKQAQTAMICCDKNGKYHLFIGVAENDSAILKFRVHPTLRITLPEKYTNAYRHFSQRLSDAVQAGQASEDWSYGHALIHYSPARKMQEKYIQWADEDFLTFKKVLRSSAYPDQRATAAQIIAYHPDKSIVIPELVYALQDEDEEVRNNAVRALAVIGYYSSIHPEKKLKIPYQPFIRMVNSVVWTDRNKGSSALMQLSRSRNEELFRQLKASCLPSLSEMALWKSEQHAIPAFVILCRMAGVTEEEISRMSTGGNFLEEAEKITAMFR